MHRPAEVHAKGGACTPDEAKLLACLPHCRSIDQRHHLRKRLDDGPVCLWVWLHVRLLEGTSDDFCCHPVQVEGCVMCTSSRLSIEAAVVSLAAGFIAIVQRAPTALTIHLITPITKLKLKLKCLDAGDTARDYLILKLSI